MSIQITGEIQKIAKRDRYRLVVRTTSGSVIADFTDQPAAKLKKGSTVTVAGTFKSQGRDTLVLADCSIAETETIRAEAVGL